MLTRQQRYSEAEGYSLAGYDILKKLANPTVSWLIAARTDLAAIYDALNQPEKATRFRSELAGSKETP